MVQMQANNRWLMLRSAQYRGRTWCRTNYLIEIIIAGTKTKIPENTRCLAIKPVSLSSCNAWHFWFPEYKIKVIMPARTIRTEQK